MEIDTRIHSRRFSKQSGRNINQRIYEYEQGRAAVSLEMLDEIAKVLLISIIDLLPESDEDSEAEEKLSKLIEEYKKIESRELRDMLIKSLF
ncbi:putative transcriptional regulator domain protein [Wolbachia endosymbiont of Trichogramma pretiosum]|nr:putative transcriptional regulator domain protein [Wolbachia endosymbiont of Trichogramma pretiosum]